MNDREEALKKGEEMFTKVYAGIVPLPPRDQRDDFFNTMLRQLFGEVWTREALSIRDRRMMLLGIAAASGEANIFAIQIAAALKNGELSAEQAEETIIHLAQYVGYPRVSSLRAIVAKAIAEIKP
ncbi:MAG: carboxymuconolactone decarboxylase family protein [Proteobacteria bacterium]|nr:carboxymuconolactone decarboxylase family protein [Pseudomonadota bacterium]HQR02729.1 carboxymuconolactone decarboxylase family protein [Rhodocyclaceae bacterium]